MARTDISGVSGRMGATLAHPVRNPGGLAALPGVLRDRSVSRVHARALHYDSR